MRAEPRQDLGSAPTPVGSTPLWEYLWWQHRDDSKVFGAARVTRSAAPAGAERPLDSEVVVGDES